MYKASKPGCKPNTIIGLNKRQTKLYELHKRLQISLPVWSRKRLTARARESMAMTPPLIRVQCSLVRQVIDPLERDLCAARGLPLNYYPFALCFSFHFTTWFSKSGNLVDVHYIKNEFVDCKSNLRHFSSFNNIQTNDKGIIVIQSLQCMRVSCNYIFVCGEFKSPWKTLPVL